MRGARLVPGLVAVLLLALPLGAPAKHFHALERTQQEGQGQEQALGFSARASITGKPTTPATTARIPAGLRQPKSKRSGRS